MATPMRLPQVDRLARSEVLGRFPERIKVAAAREAIRTVRTGSVMINGDQGWDELVLAHARRLSELALRPAINATGVILHTGLGRARLSDAAVRSIANVAQSACLLEVDSDTGSRSKRTAAVEALLVELTGAEDAFVVNNGAAGVVLALAALAGGGETLLSRGQMVEIGGSFRLPEIVSCSGSKLTEVGCTNRTRISDYGAAVSSATKAVLRCHPSNFTMTGFVEEPSARQLADFCAERNLPLIDDVGSGCVVDMENYGLPHERTLKEAVLDGASVVTASGDKLLGGPQAGLIVGKSKYVALMKQHPLARAFRIDKLCLAGLEATLMAYRCGDPDLPLYRVLSRSLQDVEGDAEILLEAAGPNAVIESSQTTIGGGSLPGQGVPTVRVGILAPDVDHLASQLRTGDRPIFCRVESGRLWIDPRTLSKTEVQEVVDTLRKHL